jgi:hypothetical protein
MFNVESSRFEVDGKRTSPLTGNAKLLGVLYIGEDIAVWN